MNRKELIAPVINLNGTSAEELIEQHATAREAVLAAMKAMQARGPNGRDYQTAPTGALRIALHQHNVWMSQLDDMAMAMLEIASQIQDQQS